MIFTTAERNRPGYQVLPGTLVTDAEYVGEKENGEREWIVSFLPYAWNKTLEELDVIIPGQLFEKRGELFRDGHRLFIEGEVDAIAPIMYAKDAWFWRGQWLPAA